MEKKLEEEKRKVEEEKRRGDREKKRADEAERRAEEEKKKRDGGEEKKKQYVEMRRLEGIRVGFSDGGGIKREGNNIIHDGCDGNLRHCFIGEEMKLVCIFIIYNLFVFVLLY